MPELSRLAFAFAVAPPIPSLGWFWITNFLETGRVRSMDGHPFQTELAVIVCGYIFAATLGMPCYAALKLFRLSSLVSYLVAGVILGFLAIWTIGLLPGLVYGEPLFQVLRASGQNHSFDRILIGLLSGCFGMAIAWSILELDRKKAASN